MVKVAGKRLFGGLILLSFLCVGGASAQWKAYNDCLAENGDFTHANVTTWTIYGGNIGNYTGPLKDFETGSTDDMPTVTFTMSGTLGTSSGGAGGNPNPGTPAYEIFGGIVDFGPNIIDCVGSEVQIIEFSNLDPSVTYTFVGTAFRRTVYSGRKTLVTISGHDGAVNNSSDGPMIVEKTPDTTVFKPGDNRFSGDVVRWDDIVPSPDGRFTIRSVPTADSDRNKSYPINGFMLEAVGPAGNRAPKVDAGVDREITLPAHNVALDATVTDDGLGAPDGYLGFTWSVVSGPAAVTFEGGADVEDPVAVFSLDGEGVYVLRLEATDGELSDFDEVRITVHPPECPLGDLDGNCLVDGGDLHEFALQWLDSPAGSADLNGDDDVDLEDYNWLAGSWRQDWQTGSLQVFIYPQSSRASALWRVDGGSWHNHGDIVDGLSIDSHTVEFLAISDFDKPADVQVDVLYGDIVDADGTYVQHTGSLKVDISPAEIVAQAKWRRVDQSEWRNSGDVEEDVAVGPQNVEFSQVSGWLSPGVSEIVVEKDTVQTLSATYMDIGDVTLRINEVMAGNHESSGIADEHGDFDDWIEIINVSDSDIDLGGMWIADDQNMWLIPTGFASETTIPSKGRLVLWADKEQDTEGPLHLPFSLDIDGDAITLYDRNMTSVIDSVSFGPQVFSVSYGRFPDAANNWYFFEDATPDAENDQAGIANKVADTTFDPDRGFYDAPIEVTIGSATDGAQIYFTTDCSDPILADGTAAAGAQLYSGPLTIETTTSLRAAAIKADSIPTNIDTHTYVFLNDVLQQATNPSTGAQVTPDGYPVQWVALKNGGGTSTVTGDYQVDPDIVNHSDPANRLTAADMRAVPTICMTMDADLWFDRDVGIYVNESITYRVAEGQEYACSFEYFDPDGSGKSIQQNCAVAMAGGVSGGGTSLGRWKVYKLSMRPRFKQTTDDGVVTGGSGKLRSRIFPDSPVNDFDSIVLDAVLNHSWLHSQSSQRNSVKYVQDQCVADFHNAMGGYSPHGAYAHVYINGMYWGMYYIHERPDHSWAAEMFGGSKDEYDAIKHNSGGVINNAVGGPGASSSYSSMLSAASAAGSDPTNLTKWQTLESQLDVDDVITYLLSDWFAGNEDWPHKNWYATHRLGGKWMYHNWDAEHSFEGSNDVGQSPDDIHGRLKNNVEYKLRWADHIHKHFDNNGPLSYPRCNEIYQARVTQVNEAIRGESARWGDNRRHPPHNRSEWLGVNTQSGTYFTNRSGNVFGWLKGNGLYPNTLPPDFEINGSSKYGGYVSFLDEMTITNPNGGAGTIWYTLNGEDPRSPGGAVNTASAIEFTGSDFPLTHSVRIKARILNGSEWSALSEAVFAVGPVAESLRITEIMFHPLKGHPDAEFIELKNVGDETINLAMARFSNGVDLELPYLQLAPDALAVVIKDKAAFDEFYDANDITLIPQAYAGSLDNGGEKIELIDALGKTIHDFRYNDTWYLGTDGEGLSINIRDPYGDDMGEWDRKRGWKASSILYGSPGLDDNGVGRGDIVINEVLSHSHDIAADWIELLNMTDESIDLGGMYLSDSKGDDPNLTKYRIGDNTMIGPAGTPSSYLVFRQNDDFTTFALSENGDEVYLTQEVGGVLTILAEEEFGASESNIAFGRYIKSVLDDGVNFVAMTSNTPGAENDYPKVDRVVITEIAYNPDSDGYAEFVELKNISGAPITLFDSEENEQWRFVDDPDAAIPNLDIKLPAVTLQNNDYFLLVKDKAAFESVFLGGNDITTLGVQWFEWGAKGGSLSNGGEQLELQMPGDVEDTQRMYVRIDRVTYSDGSHPVVGDPWPPEPDNSDVFTLNRKIATDYGNDVINWEAAAPTPGH